ncbi:hypothetical protein K2173_021732 [Erythroxylum novogranatense]|uniref:Uncharacterized protein n=1 Tax=Erythroxylum novogranatense TaxID=1862640 RepID=A0AAV8TJM8_9ROSI|nr:hypothetical protein K2173_021732 [Erythroxylum novogranatense]
METPGKTRHKEVTTSLGLPRNIYHDYHHYVGGQSQSNFASVFTYCDYLYGTDKGYRYRKKVLEKLKSKNGGNENGGSYYVKSD